MENTDNMKKCFVCKKRARPQIVILQRPYDNNNETGISDNEVQSFRFCSRECWIKDMAEFLSHHATIGEQAVKDSVEEFEEEAEDITI